MEVEQIKKAKLKKILTRSWYFPQERKQLIKQLLSGIYEEMKHLIYIHLKPIVNKRLWEENKNFFCFFSN